jgi:UDP-2-acetamido-3-amino-2,3-dideoxy-glucuronate N-acetyltransferase
MEHEGKYHSPQSWKEKKRKMAATQKKTSELDYFVHETSFVDEEVTVGKNTKIWHFCHILPHTRIGRNCSFGQNCVAGPNVTVGDGVKVQNNVSIYEGIEIEDDVFLGPSMVFTNVINPRAFIVRKTEFKKTLIKKGATVGANATVVCGVTIGEYAMIGAGAVITKDVKPFALMTGVPAKQIGWVSRAGNRLAFDESGIAVDAYDQSRYRLTEKNISPIE